MIHNDLVRDTFGAFLRRHRLDALPLWAYTPLAVIAWTPWLLALPYVFGAHPHDRFQGFSGIGGIVGAPIANWMRNREYWRLNRASRRTVLTVERTGSPSRQRSLDRLAERRLMHAVQMAQSNPAAVRVVLAMSVAGVTAVPIVAAVRSSPWWLLTLWPIAVMVAVRLGVCRPRIDDPQARLDRLRASYGGNPAS